MNLLPIGNYNIRMKLGIIIISTLTFFTFGKECNDLTSKEIDTYITSDSEILFENIYFQNVTCIEVQVYPREWVKIPNTSWIWRRALVNETTNFTKTFSVPGKIIKGTFDFLVDKTLEKFTMNGVDAQIINNSGYTKLNQIDVSNLLRSGSNTMDFSVKAESINITGGINFVLKIVSQVFI